MIYLFPNSIHEAANLLDQVKPGWEKQIDINRLAMNDDELCILGQLYGDYVEGRRRLFLNSYILPDVIFGSHSSIDRWIDEINRRLNKLLDFWSAMKLLVQGKKVRRKTWPKNEYWEYLPMGGIQHKSHKSEVNINAPLGCHLLDDWELYEEPLIFSQLKAGEKFYVLPDMQQQFTKCNGARKEAIYDGYKIMYMLDTMEVERIV